MFPIVFILFYDRDWDGRVFKLMKNDHFLVFLTVWCPFPTFWLGYGVVYVSTAKINKSVTCSCVPNLFFLFVFFILFYERSWQAEVFKVYKNDQFLVFLTV